MATPTSSQSAAKGNGTAKTTGGKKKHVASAAGAARYGKPVGSEIGGPRDANHAAIQQDQGARKSYGDLISGDPAAQRKSLDGMSTDDLNKLADIAYSFKSGDQKVVALRIAARNAQARRGIKVKVGQTQTYPKGAPAKAAPTTGKVHAMANDSANARLIELNRQRTRRQADPRLAQLRALVRAMPQAKPEIRQAVARRAVSLAREIGATHVLSSRVIELAGHWKHGYIPLDAVALESKMKGGKGKRWWSDGHGSGGVSGKLHGSPKSGSAEGSSKLTNVVKSGSAQANTRGAAVNDTYTRGHAGAKDGFDRGHRVSYTLNDKKHTGTITRIENGSGATIRRNRGEGAHDLIDRKNLTHTDTPEKQAHSAYLAAEKGSPEKTTYAAETKRHFDARAKTDIANSQKRLKALGIDEPKVGTTSATDVNKVSSGTPAELAARYVQMHGDAGTRKKIAQLEARKTLSAKDRESLAALKAAVGNGGTAKKPKKTYKVTGPDGQEHTFNSTTGPTHARFLKKPSTGEWKLMSTHGSEKAAQTGSTQSPEWRTWERKVVPLREADSKSGGGPGKA